MKLKFVFIISICLFIPAAEASTFYNITLEGNNIRLNTTLVLESKDPISIWEIVWSLPENSSIISVRDDLGEIKNYGISSNELSFSTHFKASKVRFVYIDSIIKNAVSETFKPVYSIELSLSGLPGTKTVVEVNVPNILSGYSSFGFLEAYDDNSALFEGAGAVGMKVYYGSTGKKYDNFIVFGDYDATIADKLYSVVPNITGIKPPFQRFPLVILSDDEFNEKINEWAAGTHLPGGLIVIRNSAINKESNVSIILHEVMHGFNSKVLSWDQTEIVWFDEGTGKTVEHIVNNALNVTEPSLFADDIAVSHGKKNYILLPKGGINELWDYYKKDLNFMKVWNTKDPNTREFGYAFSELVIRDYIRTNGVDPLKNVYQELAKVNHVVTNSSEQNSIFLKSMNSSFRPCFSSNYGDFVSCIESVNEYEIKVSGFSGEFIESKPVVISESFPYQSPSFPPITEQMKQPSILEIILARLRHLILTTIQTINGLLR